MIDCSITAQTLRLQNLVVSHNNTLLNKLVDLMFSSDIKLIKTQSPLRQCSPVLMLPTERELAAFLPGKHSQHSAEADLLLKCERAAERANTSATTGCLI